MTQISTTPSSTQNDQAAKELYNNYRTAMNKYAALRGHTPQPSWNNLKPWLKSVWRDAAS